MGSPVSPTVANFYTEYFEDKALTTAQNPARLWKKLMDNTSVVQYT